MNALNGRYAFNIAVRETFDGPATKLIDRTVTFHQGWESVRYNGKRYRLFGAVSANGPLFIDLSKER